MSFNAPVTGGCHSVAAGGANKPESWADAIANGPFRAATAEASYG